MSDPRKGDEQELEEGGEREKKEMGRGRENKNLKLDISWKGFSICRLQRRLGKVVDVLAAKLTVFSFVLSIEVYFGS